MLGSILLCALFAGLLLILCWFLCARFLLPIRTQDVFVVLAASGDGKTLEQQCRAWLLMKNAGIIQRPLIIADCGLNTEGRCLAEVFKELDEGIRICTAEELPEMLHIGA